MDVITGVMDISSLNKLTVPQLKNELRDRNLPLGGVKSDLVARLYQSLLKQQQQIEAQTLQAQNLAANAGSMVQLLNANSPFPTLLNTQLHLPPRVTTKVVNLSLGLVSPLDSHGSLVNAGLPGEFDNISHDGFEWGMYCTKSMDYQIWTTVYLKCIKKYKDGDQKKRVLDETVPTVEGLVEFPSGKKIKGLLNAGNSHRLYVIKNAGKGSLLKTYGARDENFLGNVKVTLKTLSDSEIRQAEQVQKKPKPNFTSNNNNEECPTAWGVYGQMDSDDDSRSEYADSSDYCSSEDEEDELQELHSSSILPPINQTSIQSPIIQQPMVQPSIIHSSILPPSLLQESIIQPSLHDNLAPEVLPDTSNITL